MDYTIPSLSPGAMDMIDKGYGFWYSTAATGVTFAAVGTSTVPMLWNPAGSGVKLRVLLVKYGGISGTVIVAHMAYGLFKNCGSQIGTAQPIVSFTAATPQGAAVGAPQQRNSVINFAPATVSMTGGPAYWRPNGISAGGALAAGPLFDLTDRCEGTFIIYPGNAFFPAVSNGALALVAAVSVLALEEPV